MMPVGEDCIKHTPMAGELGLVELQVKLELKRWQLMRPVMFANCVEY